MAKPRKLSAQEANRLAVKMQYAKIHFIKVALKYIFDGKSNLWGQEVDAGILKREQLKLTELLRIKEIHETTEYKKLPYIQTSGGSKVEKIKEHYLKGEGVVGFVEVKENSHGQSVVNHLLSKRTIKRMIKKSQQSSKLKLKQMATKKRKPVPQPVDEDLLGFDATEIDEMLEGIESEIPVYKITDKVEFMVGEVKKKGSVLKGYSEGKIKVVDAGGTVYMVKPIDVVKRETAEQARKGRDAVAYDWDEEKGHTVPRDAAKKNVKAVAATAKPAAKEVVKKTKAKGGQPTQRELVEALAEKGERDYDKIAAKTGVTRTNVGQYMYRWKKANPKKA